MDNLEFLREREKDLRTRSLGINPCADIEDKFKDALIKGANQYKSCAEELENLRRNHA